MIPVSHLYLSILKSVSFTYQNLRTLRSLLSGAQKTLDRLNYINYTAKSYRLDCFACKWRRWSILLSIETVRWADYYQMLDTCIWSEAWFHTECCFTGEWSIASLGSRCSFSLGELFQNQRIRRCAPALWPVWLPESYHWTFGSADSWRTKYIGPLYTAWLITAPVEH